MASETEVHIYALKNPDTNEVFYVGQTNDLQKRLFLHIYQAKNGVGNKKRNEAIMKIVSNGQSPAIDILETIHGYYNDNIDLINKKEQYWVSKHINTLTNNVVGGSDGIFCLNCGNEIERVGGKRAKAFCSNKCRASFHQKNKTKAKKNAKYVPIQEFKELKSRISQLEAENLALKQNKPIPPKTEEKAQKGIQNHSNDKTTNDSTNGRPIKLEGENALDYAYRVNQWKQNQTTK
jgi:predicted GIY-YIG superfamily endonuclease